MKRALDDVVVSCVNSVGVEVNTASQQLLAYVSGLNAGVAENIVRYRAEHGAFNVRVFGSVARGEADEKSDIDFLVDMEPGRSLLDMGGLLLDLQDLLGREVDVVTTVAHVCDTDIPAALELLAETDIAAVTAGPRISLDALVEEGLRPLAERRASGKVLVTP